MERKANLLRCAKLSCFAEFNRMVHTIARSVEEPSLHNNSFRMTNGSSAEHLFYTTLSSMLNHIVYNSDPESQEAELKQVYQWFCANKPLIATKTKANHQRPKLSLSSRPLAAVERPNTAPCASFPAPQSVDLPPRPFTSDHNTCPIPSFTSQYMRQSLGMELQQSEYHLPPSNSPRTTPDKTLSSDRQTRSGSRQSVCVSVVEMSSEGSDRQQCSLRPSTLLELAPVVAAKMQFQREMRSENVTPVLRRGDRSAVTTPLPNNTSSLEELPTTSSPPPPHSQPPNPKSSPQPPITELAAKPTNQHSPSRPQVHVVELDLPPTSPTARSHRVGPSALKRSGPKVASGFYCFRYKCGGTK